MGGAWGVAAAGPEKTAIIRLTINPIVRSELVTGLCYVWKEVETSELGQLGNWIKRVNQISKLLMCIKDIYLKVQVQTHLTSEIMTLTKVKRRDVQQK